jgi:hypothetical protein
LAELRRRVVYSSVATVPVAIAKAGKVLRIEVGSQKLMKYKNIEHEIARFPNRNAPVTLVSCNCYLASIVAQTRGTSVSNKGKTSALIP